MNNQQLLDSLAGYSVAGLKIFKEHTGELSVQDGHHVISIDLAEDDSSKIEIQVANLATGSQTFEGYLPVEMVNMTDRDLPLILNEFEIVVKLIFNLD